MATDELMGRLEEVGDVAVLIYRSAYNAARRMVPDGGSEEALMPTRRAAKDLERLRSTIRREWGERARMGLRVVEIALEDYARGYPPRW